MKYISLTPIGHYLHHSTSTNHTYHLHMAHGMHSSARYTYSSANLTINGLINHSPHDHRGSGTSLTDELDVRALPRIEFV